MADFAFEQQHWQEALDWGVAAIVLSDPADKMDLLPSLLKLFWKKPRPSEKCTPSELLSNAPDRLEDPIIGISLLMVLGLSTIENPVPEEVASKLLQLLYKTVPDICRDWRLNQRRPVNAPQASVHDECEVIQSHVSGLDEAHLALRRILDSADIHSFCLERHALFQVFARPPVKTLISPAFPPGMFPGRVNKLFAVLEEVRTASEHRLAEILQSCQTQIETDLQDLSAHATYVTRRYLFPVFTRAREIRDLFFESSTSTGPPS